MIGYIILICRRVSNLYKLIYQRISFVYLFLIGRIKNTSITLLYCPKCDVIYKWRLRVNKANNIIEKTRKIKINPYTNTRLVCVLYKGQKLHFNGRIPTYKRAVSSRVLICPNGVISLFV